MACCAFAIFLLSQLLAPVRTLARRLGIVRAWRPDAAVEWRPGQPQATPKILKWKRIVVVLVAVDLTALGLVGAAAAATSDAARTARSESALEQVLHKSICGSLGWRD